jgi:hypothetical protein
MLNIDDVITQSLVKDFKIPEEKAIDLYFNSDTYRQLTDETTGLFLQSWEDVYKRLKQELNV